MQGLWRDEDHRYFVHALIDADHEVEAGPLTSVTTAIGILDRSGPLVGWAKRETAACAVRNIEVVGTMIREAGPEAATRWLSSIPDYQRESSATLGTRIHQLAEAIGNGQTIETTEAEDPKVRGYLRFLHDREPELVGIEQLVVNLTEGYGGTADLFALMDDALWVLDIKTGKGIYPEMGLQLAGLGYAEYWGKPGDLFLSDAPRPTRFGVVHLKDDAYDLVEFAIDDSEYRAFLNCVALWTWEHSQAVIVKEQQR